ncbi:MAG: hypothetical protein ACE5HS_19775 [bacterium]
MKRYEHNYFKVTVDLAQALRRGKLILSFNRIIKSMMRLKLFFFCSGLIFSIILLVRCSGPFPSISKSGLPSDHTEKIKGVLHKKGFKYPYKTNSGCSDSKCHQDDLDGGVAEVDGKITISPSCFQCHETLWEDDIDEEN